MLDKYRLEDYNLVKKNYKGNKVLAIGGFILSLGTLPIWYILFKFNYIDYNIFSRYIFIGLMIGTTGFLDDIAGNKESQGLKGHFFSLFRGKLTTGIIKVIVISFSAILLVNSNMAFTLEERILDIGIIILLTNFLNLLDLRPGRSIKFFLIISIFLLNKGKVWLYFLPYYLIIFLYLPYELKGLLMLGDSGANILGFVLGYTLVNSIASIEVKYIILLSLFIVTLLSEKYSFSSIIMKNRVLNWLDNLGR